MPAVTKAVIPAAGLGTRFLPATKAAPKELLPVVDKPTIQYVVEEAAAAGLDDVLLVTGRGKEAIEDHFDTAPALESALSGDPGKAELLARVRRAAELATVHAVRQREPKGLGHAVACAARHVGERPFAVLLGDDIIDERTPWLPRLLDVQASRGGCVLGLLDVGADEVGRYGVAAAEPTPEPDVVRVTGLVEKPDPAEAPSTLAVMGRYVLAPQIFAVLHDTPPGSGGEIQLTDAIATLARRAAEGGPVHGVVFSTGRYDAGAPEGWLRTCVELACDRADLGPDFFDWLTSFVDRRRSPGGSGPAVGR
jgi:UTP--glucose-1-phosphate uridylyltransferase